MSVTISGKNFEDSIANIKDGNIKGTTTEVEDGDFFIFVRVDTIGQGSGGRLIDNTLDFKTSDFAGVFGGLALGVIEIGRHSNDGFGDRFA